MVILKITLCLSEEEIREIITVDGSDVIEKEDDFSIVERQTNSFLFKLTYKLLKLIIFEFIIQVKLICYLFSKRGKLVQ